MTEKKPSPEKTNLRRGARLPLAVVVMALVGAVTSAFVFWGERLSEFKAAFSESIVLNSESPLSNKAGIDSERPATPEAAIPLSMANSPLPQAMQTLFEREAGAFEATHEEFSSIAFAENWIERKEGLCSEADQVEGVYQLGDARMMGS